MTANQDYFNEAIRNQVAVRRYTTAQLKAMVTLLDRADRDLAALLRERLAVVVGGKWTTQRLGSLLADVRQRRAALVAELGDRVARSLEQLSAQQAAAELDMIRRTVPVDLTLATVPMDRLNAAVASRPFQGQVLSDWFTQLAAVDGQRLSRTIQLGVVEGRPIDQIVRQVVGTRKLNYQDGILNTTRRNAEALVRTAVNHTSNFAREAAWGANRDIIHALRWTSTLDGRTSAICQARDGDLTTIDGSPLPEGVGPQLQPPGARPPAHFNCRSVMVAVLSPEGIVGSRPFVRDTRTRREREVDFRAMARGQNKAMWRSMSVEQRNAAIAQQRSAWAAQNIGTVPARTTYSEWISTQPASVQDAILGPGRGELLRGGKLTVDDFVDMNGRERTLDELAKMAS